MAGELGIGMVHQHFMLVEPFTVTENIILGKEPVKGGMDRSSGAEREVREISNRTVSVSIPGQNPGYLRRNAAKGGDLEDAVSRSRYSDF